MSPRRRELREIRQRTRTAEYRALRLGRQIWRLRAEWRAQNSPPPGLRGVVGRRGGEKIGADQDDCGLLPGGFMGEAGLKLWALDWELIERRIRES
ncbi:MAG: hypothetical protein ACOYLF_06255 [Blastocatellia bacterium]|jgi:hypothetical protein